MNQLIERNCNWNSLASILLTLIFVLYFKNAKIICLVRKILNCTYVIKCKALIKMHFNLIHVKNVGKLCKHMKIFKLLNKKNTTACIFKNVYKMPILLILV